MVLRESVVTRNRRTGRGTNPALFISNAMVFFPQLARVFLVVGDVAVKFGLPPFGAGFRGGGSFASVNHFRLVVMRSAHYHSLRS